MATVDYSTAHKIATGEYKEDGFKSIIIYCDFFGGISFKLCHEREDKQMMTYFHQGHCNPMIVWQEGVELADFKTAVLKYHQSHACRKMN